MEYVATSVEDGGIKVEQVFFHDPDGYMIEICNCDKLPILPLSSCPSFSATSCSGMHILLFLVHPIEMSNFVNVAC